MNPSASRRALFGGSFDPVHPGHVAIARAAVEQAGLDQVIFLPAAQSPLKSHGPQATGAQRMEMLEAALKDMHWAQVSDWELGRPGPSYSWQTARHFREAAGSDVSWFWLMGEDQWDQLERWQNWQQLSADVIFLVFTRAGRTPGSREGVRAQFLSGEFPGSSTAIRLARRERSEWKPLVHPDVAAVIDREGLYL